MNAKDNTAVKYPKTLVEAVRYFSDPAVAVGTFVDLRWPDGVCCPRCGSTHVCQFGAERGKWKCREGHPAAKFTVKVGTVMEDSPMGLDKWAVALWLEVNAKNSISSYEIARALGVTQKSAWFMLHRIRFALHQGTFAKPMEGVIEADETFIGGLAKNMHAAKRRRVITGTGGANKTAVMGLLERHTVGTKKVSKVRAMPVPNTQRATLHTVIGQNVAPGATIYTDAHAGYGGLQPAFFHAFVDHAERYVIGQVHTNGLENFWALFKRCVKGTHVSIEPYHLLRYLDAECFRFNNRDMTDGERFRAVAAMLAGKRLTYKALTGALEGLAAGDEAASQSGQFN